MSQNRVMADSERIGRGWAGRRQGLSESDSEMPRPLVQIYRRPTYWRDSDLIQIASGAFEPVSSYYVLVFESRLPSSFWPIEQERQ